MDRENSSDNLSCAFLYNLVLRLMKHPKTLSEFVGRRKFNVREVTVMSYMVTNFCKQEEMSVCTAGDKKKQLGCSFYEKSQFAERCMYFMFDEYCDSLKAQMNAEEGFRN